MDNGWSVSAATAFTDAAALSSNSVTLTMGDMGKLAWGHSMAGLAGNYDDVGAGAYEEVDDGAPTSLSTNLMGTTVDNGGIFYTSPSIDAAGASLTMHIGYTPKVGNADIAGGGASGVQDMGSAQNIGLTMAHESGLTVGAWVNEISRNSTAGEDSFQGAWYAKYAFGPIALAYGQSYVNNGVSGAADTAGVAKTFAAGTGLFENEQYVVTMNVNDNLSVSYGKADDTYDARAGAASATTTGGGAVADVTMGMKSIQAAYSMGSMSIKAYRLDVDNVGYNTTGGSNQKTEIALGLSF